MWLQLARTWVGTWEWARTEKVERREKGGDETASSSLFICPSGARGGSCSSTLAGARASERRVHATLLAATGGVFCFLFCSPSLSPILTAVNENFFFFLASRKRKSAAVASLLPTPGTGKLGGRGVVALCHGLLRHHRPRLC